MKQKIEILTENKDFILIKCKNKTFKISPEDKNLLEKNWSITKEGMVLRQAGTYPNKRKIYLHLEILENPKFLVFHKNQDLSDNTRDNLKIHKNNRRDKSSLYGFLKSILHNSKGTAKNRLRKGRIEAGIHSIIFDDLMELWNNQKGLCYYSNLPMNHKPHSDWNVSLERLNQEKGYIKDNIVLCCQEFNGRIQWDLNKINNISSLRNENYIFDKKIIETSLKILIGSTLGNCIRSNKLFDITIEDLKDQYVNQNGRCAYSNIILNPVISHKNKHYKRNSNWKMSIERKDVKIGYTKENILLICLEFNTSDKSNTTINPSGSSRWTLEKFNIFLKSKFENNV